MTKGYSTLTPLFLIINKHFKTMKKVILASTSPRRKELLKNIGLKFMIVESDYEEDMGLKMSPMKLARYLSNGKAQAVAKKFANHIIIGADTFVILDNKLLGKPHTAEKAKEMLKKISGKKIYSITGYTIIDSKTGKLVSRSFKSTVYIKKINKQTIDNYVDTKEPLDRAGAFAIQGIGASLIDKIKGDYFNIIGLPIYDVIKDLNSFGVKII